MLDNVEKRFETDIYIDTNYFPPVLRVQTNSGGYTPSYLLFISLRLKRPGRKTEYLQQSRGRMCGAASTHSKVYVAW